MYQHVPRPAIRSRLLCVPQTPQRFLQFRDELGNSRSMLDFNGTYYVFQVGRQIQMTFEAKL